MYMLFGTKILHVLGLLRCPDNEQYQKFGTFEEEEVIERGFVEVGISLA